MTLSLMVTWGRSHSGVSTILLSGEKEDWARWLWNSPDFAFLTLWNDNFPSLSLRRLLQLPAAFKLAWCSSHAHMKTCHLSFYYSTLETSPIILPERLPRGWSFLKHYNKKHGPIGLHSDSLRVMAYFIAIAQSRRTRVTPETLSVVKICCIRSTRVSGSTHTCSRIPLVTSKTAGEGQGCWCKAKIMDLTSLIMRETSEEHLRNKLQIPCLLATPNPQTGILSFRKSSFASREEGKVWSLLSITC